MTIIKSITRKFIQATLLISVGFNLALATELKLPSDTPGLQKEIVQKNVNGTLTDCIEIKIPETDYSLFFPKNGAQPTTQEVGEYSGARYNYTNISNWYTKMFINFIISKIDENIKLSINETFSKITTNPVGKTLLYRLLIEIYRFDKNNNGCCEDTTPNTYLTAERNLCRNLEIKPWSSPYFVAQGKCIYWSTSSVKSFFVKINQQEIEESFFDLDELLFHELLHWFHYLRHPLRFTEYRIPNQHNFQYPARCFYGNTNDLESWGAHIDSEEIATILGVPNYNNPKYIDLIHSETFLKQKTDFCIKINNHNYIPLAAKFLNGDDISENAYRIAAQKDSIRCGYSLTYPFPEKWRSKLYITLAKDYYEQIMNL